MIDAHTHVRNIDYLNFLINNHIKAIISTANINEYNFIKDYLNDNLYFSIGIHPWYSYIDNFEDIKNILKYTNIMGEIGMDNVWCNVDLKLQREIFIKEIRYAYENHKKVVLHTKGMEKEILDIIKDYPNIYLVHWYDFDQFLDDYIALDTYFTIGPDLDNPNIIELINKVPLNRLLIESDGIDSISWINNRDHITFKEYLKTLDDILKLISKIKNKPYDEVKMIINDNFERFVR